MLYDKRWDLKPDLEYRGISLRAFSAWLDEQNPTEEFDYGSPFECAIAQYKRSLGFVKREDIGISIVGPGSKWLYDIVNCTPPTFGRAASVARAKLR
jgi:hypothetical protein